MAHQAAAACSPRRRCRRWHGRLSRKRGTGTGDRGEPQTGTERSPTYHAAERRVTRALPGPRSPVPNPWSRVKPLPPLLPQVPGQDHALQQRRRREARLAELVEQDVGDEIGGVEADEVQQGERAHRVAAAELHPRVDVLNRPEAVLEAADRVEQVGHQRPVDDEAAGDPAPRSASCRWPWRTR